MVGWTFSFNRKGQTSAGPKGLGGVAASRRWYLVWCEGFIARGYAKTHSGRSRVRAAALAPFWWGCCFCFGFFWLLCMCGAICILFWRGWNYIASRSVTVLAAIELLGAVCVWEWVEKAVRIYKTSWALKCFFFYKPNLHWVEEQKYSFFVTIG